MALVNAPENFGLRRHLEPDFVPSSATDVVGADCYVEEIVLTGVTSATVTIWDKQATPKLLASAVSVDAGDVLVMRFDGRYCPGGVRWQASAANACVGYMRIR